MEKIYGIPGEAIAIAFKGLNEQITALSCVSNTAQRLLFHVKAASEREGVPYPHEAELLADAFNNMRERLGGFLDADS